MMTNEISVANPQLAALYQDTTFTDVVIKCKDGKELKAHKVVLSISTPYFKALFSGNWAETCDGCITANTSQSVMKKFLQYLYTGKTYTILKNRHASCLSLWELGIYYHVPRLTATMEDACIERTTPDNVINLLVVVAKFPNHKSLKKKCYKFIKTHTAELLGNPDIIRFAEENPEIWAAVRKTIDPRRTLKRKRNNVI